MMCRLSTLLVGKQRNNVDMYPGALYLVVMSEYIVLCRKYSIWRLSSGNIHYLLMIVIILLVCLIMLLRILSARTALPGKLESAN